MLAATDHRTKKHVHPVFARERHRLRLARRRLHFTPLRPRTPPTRRTTTPRVLPSATTRGHRISNIFRNFAEGLKHGLEGVIWARRAWRDPTVSPTPPWRVPPEVFNIGRIVLIIGAIVLVVMLLRR